MIEAKKLAYADMLRYVGDPKFSQVPVEGMLSKNYAAERAKLIDMAKANCDVSPGEPAFPTMRRHHLSFGRRSRRQHGFADSEQLTRASVPGSSPTGPGSRCRIAAAFSALDPASPNALAGHKRPLHTIIPAFMTRGDERIAFGIMGGFNQAQAHAQFVSNIVDFGMNIQECARSRRASRSLLSRDATSKWKTVFKPRCATRSPDAGTRLKFAGNYSANMGGGQAVRRVFAKGVNYGASDPRKDGAAIPESPPLK